MNNLEYLETAFHQLSFAIKLWNYAREGLIDKDKFDINLTVEDDEDRIVLLENEFNTYDDIILATENAISTFFGITANVLWECINERGIYSPPRTKLPDPLVTPEQKLVGFAYMLRCCFAHGPAIPKWHITDKKYRTQYIIGNKLVDLTKFGNIGDENVFNYRDIGGYETLWILKHELMKLNII
ncbi:MAG: hypothetical protein K6U03_03655 [Firmicutes bacterium]|nr:hypothetical protein [Bacillota bacterium]